MDSGRVARPFDWRLDDDPPWIAYAWVPGSTLRDRLDEAEGRSLRIAQLLTVFRDVAVALVAIHRQGIRHRDLKPANIMVTPMGEAVVIDLGVAIIGEQSEYSRGAWGTDGYRAPEQQWGSSTDARMDVWSFGVCLLEAATGRRAFGSPYDERYHERVLHQPDLVGVPWLLADLVDRCVSHDVQRRPTAEGLVEWLEDIRRDWDDYVRDQVSLGNAEDEDRVLGEVVTRLRREPLEVRVGYLGQLHFVAKVAPTTFPGTDFVVSDVSLDPFTRWRDRPRAGDHAVLEYAQGTVVLVDSVPDLRRGDETEFALPKNCPSCSRPLLHGQPRAVGRKGDGLYCNAGRECPAQAAASILGVARALVSWQQPTGYNDLHRFMEVQRALERLPQSHVLEQLARHAGVQGVADYVGMTSIALKSAGLGEAEVAAAGALRNLLIAATDAELLLAMADPIRSEVERESLTSLTLQALAGVAGDTRPGVLPPVPAWLDTWLQDPENRSEVEQLARLRPRPT